MHKSELIKGLRSKLLKINGSINGHNHHQWWHGQRAFARFLIYYLENLDIASDEKYDFWDIEPYLPEIVVDAFEHFRTSTDDAVASFRSMYEEETGHEVPNITDVGASDILHQGSAIQTTLGFMLSEITGQKWVEKEIDAYCNAQKYYLQQIFDKFIRRVYRNGMYELVYNATSGMSGTFGTTELRTYSTAGRVMFTFARAEGEGELSVSFVAEDGDPNAYSAGLQTVYATLFESISMIEEVINNWPIDANEQAQQFTASESVMFDVVAAIKQAG